MKQENKKQEVKKEVMSNKSILIIVCAVLVVLLFIFYFYRANKISNANKLQTSYLLDNNTINLEIKNLDEVQQILTETPTEFFVLISYTGSEDTYNLEVDLKDIITTYGLSDSFYYLNVDNIKDEDNYITRLNNAFNTDKITTVPTILYFKEGTLVDIVKRYDDQAIKAADFQKLLDIYEYEHE